MINNPKLIEKIKSKIRNTTKEQLDKAIKEVDKEYYTTYEYNAIIDDEYPEVDFIFNEYNDFYLHNNKATSLLGRILKNRKNSKKTELEAA